MSVNSAEPRTPPDRRRPAARRAWQPAAALATGAALWAAFPGPDLGPLAFVALVPLLVAVEPARPRQAFALGFLAGLVFFGLHVPWVVTAVHGYGAGTLTGYLAWGALSASQALAVAAFAALVPALRRAGAWRLVLLPACWAGLELVRAYAPLGGFPWGLLGLTQHGGGPLLPLARVVGTFGLAAVIAAVNVAAAAGLRAAARPGRVGARARAAAAWALPAALLPLAGLLAPDPPPAAGEPLDLVVVQGNVPAGDRGDRALVADRVFGNHVRRTLALAGGPAPDLVVWPESAADRDPLDDPAMLAGIREAAQAARAPVLLGATTTPQPRRPANEALLFDEDGRLAGRYAKRRLVPYGERTYFRWLVEPLAARLPADKVPGRDLDPLDVAGARVGVLICYESGYPADAAALARRGAGLLVVITNNASFGNSPAPRQHLATSQLRAVESGRAVVHAALTGSSAVVGPDGRAYQRTGLFEEATVRALVVPREGLTFYARWGRAVEALLAALAVAALAVPLGAGLRRRARPPAAEPGGSGYPAGASPQAQFPVAEPSRGRRARPGRHPHVQRGRDHRGGARPGAGRRPPR